MIAFSIKEIKLALVAIAVIASISAAGILIYRTSGHSYAMASLAKAKELQAKNNLRGARAELLNAVAADPEFADAYIAQADVALALFDGDDAWTALEKAIAIGAPQAEIQHLLGYALLLQGELARAENLLSDDAIPEKNKAYAFRILGKVLMAQGKPDEARNAYDAALKITPKDGLLWTDIAAYRLQLIDQKGAIEASEYAVSLDSRNIRTIEMRGRLIRSQYGLAAALPWFELGLSIDPSDVPLLEEYAVTLGEMGRNAQMLKQSRKILSLNPKDGRAYYMQAVIAARARDYMLTQRILSLAGSSINETPGAMMISAITQYQLGNYNRASDTLERLLATQPSNIEVREMLARAKQNAGENYDALNVIKPLVARGQAGTYDAMITARAFEASGDRIRAVAGLNDSAAAVQRKAAFVPEFTTLTAAANGVQRNPGNAFFTIPYIRTLMQDGQFDAAFTYARQLQTNAPGAAAAHLIVGDVEAARGNYAAATIAYQKAREIEFSEGTMLRLVDVYRRQKQGNKARDALAVFIGYNPRNLSAQRLTAYQYLDDGKWSDALLLLEKLRKRTGYNDSILNANIARAYSGSGQNEKAVFNAKIAYLIDPANPMITLVYAQCLLKSGSRPKAALELFEKADALVSGNVDVAKGLKAARANYKKNIGKRKNQVSVSSKS